MLNSQVLFHSMSSSHILYTYIRVSDGSTVFNTSYYGVCECVCVCMCVWECACECVCVCV